MRFDLAAKGLPTPRANLPLAAKWAFRDASLPHSTGRALSLQVFSRPMRSIFALPILLIAMVPGAAVAQGKPVCAALEDLVIPSSEIGLPTRGAVVARAKMVAGEARHGSYCLVQGEIAPVDQKAASIKFAIALPERWNAKALMLGGGGFDGIIPDVVHQLAHAAPGAVPPLARGYAIFGSDSGHQMQTPAESNSVPNQDAAFFGNDETRQNYMADALKKTRDTAFSIIAKAYGQKPTRSYFIGGSKGGNEAMTVTGRWPNDWDGVIAYYPVRSYTLSMLSVLSVAQTLAAPGAYPNLVKRRVLHDAAIEACDALDGVTDGIISNIVACRARFDPSTADLRGVPVRCAAGLDTGDTCLSDTQIRALKRIGSPITFPYLPRGQDTFQGFDLLFVGLGNSSASSLEPYVAAQLIGSTAPKFPSAEGNGRYFVGADDFFRFAVANDNAFNSLAMNLQDPGPLTARLQALAAKDQMNETNADEDLSPFAARGGKLILIQGTEDLMVSSRATEAYYNRLRKTMGATKTDQTVRFYLIPGYGHGVSTVFNARGDELSLLENWVEKGEDPADRAAVVDVTGVPGRTRPLCRYPAWPKYTGAGNANDAASFKCVVGSGS
ncbi:tannase/feruloyl esterase family alpha/beta hydrolase [Sphingomonas oligophenolica]|uniref:Tannase/feruloyl esterase family alpha/beta hydrolase n=1 Tax=Sphingomonas oligophenolica TaxID=301154 RepID=A0ABU9Y680_9SPHN